MRLFRRKNNLESRKLNLTITQKSAFKNSFLFVIGTLISALSFNLFYLPYNFVGGGLGGVAVILNDLFSWDSTMVIMIGNAIFIAISILTIGFKESLFGLLGATLYTLFAYFTKDVPSMINFSFDNVLLYVLAAGVVGGFGESLVYIAGFNTGGTSILAKVIQKYTNQTLGDTLRMMSYIVIAGGGIFLGYTSIMYSILITTISTYMIDKMLIGISESKTFFIQTDKQEEVIDFVLTIIESGVTELDTRGAYSHKKNKMLMCVVPTEKYSLLKSAIKEIDPNAFIVVSDCYEVLGGTKRKKLLFN